MTPSRNFSCQVLSQTSVLLNREEVPAATSGTRSSRQRARLVHQRHSPCRRCRYPENVVREFAGLTDRSQVFHVRFCRKLSFFYIEGTTHVTSAVQDGERSTRRRCRHPSISVQRVSWIVGTKRKTTGFIGFLAEIFRRREADAGGLGCKLSSFYQVFRGDLEQLSRRRRILKR